jgi:hypothetical protein
LAILAALVAAAVMAALQMLLPTVVLAVQRMVLVAQEPQGRMQIILLAAWEGLGALTAVPPGLLAGAMELPTPGTPAHLITGLGAAVVVAVAVERGAAFPVLAVVVVAVEALLMEVLFPETPDFRDARPVQLRTTV